MAENFTAADTAEMNIPLPLLKEWDKLMQQLWKMCNQQFKHVESPPNEIKINDMIVGAYFFNKEYIQVEVKKSDTVILQLRHNSKQIILSDFLVYTVLCQYLPVEF